MAPDDLIRASAANEAAWQEASLRHLGRSFAVDGPLWTCQLPGPDIWHTALVLQREDVAARNALRRHVAASTYVSVCDTWRTLDLRSLGLECRATGHWYHRPASQWQQPSVPRGIEVQRVTTSAMLEALEQAAAVGFAAPVTPDPGSIHPPELLHDSDAVLVVALSHGNVVGTALGHVAAGVLGIYGVSTLPAHRRRGIATALTASVGASHPDLDAVLQPSPAAASLYRRLGFNRIGSFAHWVRAPGATTSG